MSYGFAATQKYLTAFVMVFAHTTSKKIRRRHIVIMGLGLHGGGVGAVKFFAGMGAYVTVTDLRSKKELQPSLRKLSTFKNIRYVLGRHRAEDFKTADLIIKNPGVRPDSPFLQLARRYKIPITTDIDVFFAWCPAPIIGITGTRGKSTTSALLHAFLVRHQGPRHKIYLGGNIQKSVLDFLPCVGSDDLVVLELSSFQLYNLYQQKKSPHIAVITNIFRDHLNWHPTMAHYIKAKSAIFCFQTARDFLFIDSGNVFLKKLVRGSRAHITYTKLPQSLTKLVDVKLGSHYRSSVGLAVAVARHFGVRPSAIWAVLRTFHGLAGRQEDCGTIRGVRIVNDTTATSPDAAIAALKQFGSRKGKRHLIWIGGGQDKRLEFSALISSVVAHADVVILLPGTATDIISRALKIKEKAFFLARSMDEAVLFAFHCALPNDTIMLSPGAASFGLFLNEFDRGAAFVRALKRHKT